MTFAVTFAAAAVVLAAAWRLNTLPPLMTGAWVPYGTGRPAKVTFPSPYRSARWPNPNSRTTPMTTDTLRPELDTPDAGDLVNTDEEPCVDPGQIGEPVRVYVDVIKAQGSSGDHALCVDLPNSGELNAAQAEQLRLALNVAVPWLAQLRSLQGHPA